MHCGVRRHSVHEEQLGRTAEEDSLDRRFQEIQGLLHEAVNDPFEGDPSSHGGVVNGVGQGRIPIGKAIDLDGGEPEVRPSPGLLGKLAAGSSPGGCGRARRGVAVLILLLGIAAHGAL